MTVFNQKNIDSTTQKVFFGEPLSVARYDKLKYNMFDKFTEKQMGFFWRPEEVDISKDGKDFKTLSEHEQHIFTSNLKRQILLDSVQGRGPVQAFLPITSLPEYENWLIAWSFFETIHSRSYTHIIRNIYSNPSEVFDSIMDIDEIADCAQSISSAYDNLIEFNNSPVGSYGSYEHKKALWVALNAVNALEGIRFYVSFACSWAFAELKKMEGNAKIIKFIARDENVHLASTQQLIKILPKEDRDFEKIREEMTVDIVKIFNDVVQQEQAWAKYLFKDGSLIGLNEQLLCDYVEWIANKRMHAVGLPSPYKGGTDPLSWTQKWISGSEVQVAPQETEIVTYIVGGIKKDISAASLKQLKL
jgi:ribonucleoside-diphosphate reductase beta chain